MTIHNNQGRIRCKYCGALLRQDADGVYCPTKNCQWSLTGSGGADELKP